VGSFSVYINFTYAYNVALSRQLMNMKTHKLSYRRDKTSKDVL